MSVKFLSRDDRDVEGGIVCVIDVISAFTTSAYLFSQGAQEIIIARTKEDALSLNHSLDNCCLIGEHNGNRIDGFHYHNSATEFPGIDFSDKTVILKTSSGTRGLLNNLHADVLLAASFSNALATGLYIRQCMQTHGVQDITFIVTNSFKSGEDVALAGFLCEIIFNNDQYSLGSYLDIVRSSRYSKDVQRFGTGEMDLVLSANLFNFVMIARSDSGLDKLVAHPVDECGLLCR